ncbi:hypothetical protein BP5796_05982 [Coleophoma crateriformis]|uniref:Uncharacterized protein n=1 Tax=Coleophoma crateriformis TaxID=565419 RepID=A0A3D8RW13_9HELO|nr:hypothetical protein BP5796_05982 [Coleophoma crateriformis]
MASELVTEIVYMPLKPGIDIKSFSTPESKAWLEALDIMKRQEGYLQSRCGRQFENPDMLMWFIGNRSLLIERPPTPATYPSSAPSTLAIDHASSANPFPKPKQIGHRTLPTANSSPPLLTPLSTVPTFLADNAQKFAAALDSAEPRPNGYLGSVAGSVMEDIAKGGAEEGKGSAVVLCLGWTSRDAHLRFRNESVVFKENIWLLREGTKGAEVVHVGFEDV